MSEAIWERSRSAPGRAASRTRLAGHQPLRRAPDFLWLTRTHVADDARNRPCITPPGVNSDRRNGTRLPDAPYAPPPPPGRSRAATAPPFRSRGLDCRHPPILFGSKWPKQTQCFVFKTSLFVSLVQFCTVGSYRGYRGNVAFFKCLGPTSHSPWCSLDLVPRRKTIHFRPYAPHDTRLNGRKGAGHFRKGVFPKDSFVRFPDHRKIL